jgi:hypothetical protein
MEAVNQDVLSRVLSEIHEATASETIRASHSSFVSGVFEADAADNSVLQRVLEEIEEAKASDTIRASHSSFVSGVFES